MSDTTRLGLPLLQPAQAQKHVTVNESLMRLDGIVQLTLVSRTQSTPPASVGDGVCYAVPSGAVNAWAGQAGRIAIGANGGWVFADPARGWRAMILDEGATSLFDGTAWRDGMVTLSPHNAGLSFGVAEIDHVIASGPTSTTVVVIPAPSVVIGVTARVTQAITGTLASWTLGTAVSPGQFGTGLGLATGSWCRGLLGQPTAYYLPEALQLDGTGGDFSGGTIRIAVHFMEIALPDQ